MFALILCFFSFPFSEEFLYRMKEKGDLLAKGEADISVNFGGNGYMWEKVKY